MSKKYAELKAELQQIVDKLQTDDIDIEEAMTLHKQANQLLDQLEKRLSKAEANLEITKLEQE